MVFFVFLTFGIELSSIEFVLDSKKLNLLSLRGDGLEGNDSDISTQLRSKPGSYSITTGTHDYREWIFWMLCIFFTLNVMTAQSTLVHPT